jgi:tRNA threonylcarbamoyladenosine biosynthesis protein TsaB
MRTECVKIYRKFGIELMSFLALDTSTHIASVALSAEGKIWCSEEQETKQHAQTLLPMIDDLMQQASIDRKQLQGIIFGRGPGSFTGLRIGCSIAQSLAFGLNIPIYPVSTLLAIGYNASQKFGNLPILTMLDARMKEVYWAEYFAEQLSIEHVSTSEQVTIEHTGEIILAGVGFEPYEQALPAALLTRIRETCVIYPSPAAMIELVQAAKVRAVPCEKAVPVYIRDNVTQPKEYHG